MAYSWLPFFRELAKKLGSYRGNQIALIECLRQAGISNGFTDKNSHGDEISLTEIDPFTAFGSFLKFGGDRRAVILASLKEALNISSPVPSDYDGVPTFQAQNFWLFPYKANRTQAHLKTLWELYDQCIAGKIESSTFSSALDIPAVGVAKLTQSLFCINPSSYFPVDGQTRPYLQKRGINCDLETLEDYELILGEVRKKFARPFCEISYTAWRENQGGSGDDFWRVKLTQGAIDNGYIRAGQPNEYFPKRYFGGSDESAAAEQFSLKLPNGTTVLTDIRGSEGGSGRIRRRFNVLMSSLNPGDEAIVQKISDGVFELAFQRTGDGEVIAPPGDKDGAEVNILKVSPLNQIFYGPPGTGKTYATIDSALSILDPKFLALNIGDRFALKARFDSLTAAGHIRFVTFHQSFSYEDFVEGIRADNGPNGDLRYDLEDGVFKSLCDAALVKVTQQADAPLDLSGRRIWKMSLGNTLGEDAYIFDECITQGYSLLGYGGVIDFSGCTDREQIRKRFIEAGEEVENSSYAVTAVSTFMLKMKQGDLIVVTDGNLKFRAIGEVTGEYRCLPRKEEDDGYGQCRDVRWLRVYKPSLPFDQVMNNKFSQMTLYELWPDFSIDIGKLGALLGRSANPSVEFNNAKVLIIDEINRGNISRIFGELITLIEPSKRLGMPEALQTILPYSKKLFGVPGNVYLIGTMNTADRSLAGLDIALRRRFSFREMPPRPESLEGGNVNGVDIEALLRVINERIELLLDRDHCLGHAYFLPLKEEPSLEMLRDIFESKVIPLLQEYFFEDWNRIQWVLNDHRKPAQYRFIEKPSVDIAKIFGDGVNVNEQNLRWKIRSEAFDLIDSYGCIIDASEFEG